jgi:hypothetical protein
MPAAGGNTKSGKFGKLHFNGSEILEITEWSLDIKNISEKYASSSTGGWKTSRQGVSDSSGSFSYKMDHDTGDAIHNKIPFDDADGMGFEGDLLLYVDATNYYTVPALIGSFRVQVDIDNGNVVGGSADFEGTGPITQTW